MSSIWRNSSGSAIVIAMLLLVLISAAGIYVISLQRPAVQSMNGHEHEAVAKWMAVAGVHAVAARISHGALEGPPYVRSFDVARNITGTYTVSFRESTGPKSAGDSSAKEYVVLSEGSIVQSRDVKHIARATLLCFPKEQKCRIVMWEESK
ncbi:MAG: hypothetical protein FWH25_02810 [Syntrophorhabdaceae bacterium]|nr:hypothetical protein [Syntrophorhabdaceae bacterium]